MSDFLNRPYCGRGGRCLVRYDNETGKGDHRHYGTHEEAYRFVSLEGLIQDFRADCTLLAGWRWEVGMKRIEIEVLGGEAALKAFAKTWRQARTGRHVVPRIAFGSLSELFSTVTEKRLALIRHVAAHGALNTRQLAHALGRDYKNVHSDVRALIETGLLEKDAHGRLTTAFDEIVIRAGLRTAA